MKDIEGALLNPGVAGPQCQEKKEELNWYLNYESLDSYRVDVLK